jgi:hypothetical protein
MLLSVLDRKGCKLGVGLGRGFLYVQMTDFRASNSSSGLQVTPEESQAL